MRRYVEQILSLYNYVDGIVITNQEGIIEYYNTFRPEINNLKEEEVLGKHLIEVYPCLTEEKSSIFRVLRSGKPIFNEKQHLITFKGHNIFAVNTTLPILKGDKIVGAVDVSRYLDPDIRRENILLTLKEPPQRSKGDDPFYDLNDIVTKDPALIQIKDQVQRVAQTQSSVLVSGETGTGKELIVQSLHGKSQRAQGPFISQNCAAIPSTLLESILFGTVKGSYTGAENRKGLFEEAQGGTLFLDEIDSMDFNIQAKLLKVLEERQFRKVGSLKPIKADVRFISAMNEDLWKSIENKRLREDLFYRLGVVQINLPPLRTRKKDISLLTMHFIKQFNHKMGRSIAGISEDVEKFFREYHWPGNVRELKNVIEGAFNLNNTNLIQMRDLPNYLRDSHRQFDSPSVNLPVSSIGEDSLKEMVDQFEKQIIAKALSKTKNQSECASLLKISKQTLQYKLSKYGLRK